MSRSEDITLVDRLRMQSSESEWLEAVLRFQTGFEARVVDHPDGRVVVFEVASAKNRPVSLLGTAYVRVARARRTGQASLGTRAPRPDHGCGPLLAGCPKRPPRTSVGIRKSLSINDLRLTSLY